jgi:hypothetical protein
MTEATGWGMAVDDTYRIRVSGHLDDRWSEWLEGLAVQRRDDGTTVLVGPVVDQAALHGVIARIRDLGLPLLSVRRMVGAHGRANKRASTELRPRQAEAR